MKPSMKKVLLILIFLSKLAFSQSISYTSTGGTTIFDLQSNGTINHVIQDKNNPDNIHAVYMSSAYNDPAFAERTVQYLYSSDKGETWSFLTNVPFAGRSGFPSISLVSSGSALISLNYTVGNLTSTTTLIDAFPGLGSFSYLGNPPCNGLWPQVIGSNSLSQTNKFYLLNSAGFTAGLSITNSSYSACSPINGSAQSSTAIYLGADGRIGIVYIADPTISPADEGDVFFIESTDNGQTFSPPLKIYDATINADNTYKGAFRGISLVYSGNTPNVVFEVTKQNTSGAYFPKEPGGIMFWSPLLSGSNPNKSKYIARNDSTGSTGYIPFYKAFGHDVLTSICRPSIGVMNNENYMGVVFMSSTPDIMIKNNDIVNYNSLYISFTGNKGLTWRQPKKITPDELKDWTYPSISSFNFTSNLYTANIVASCDSIPGSYVNNPSSGKSLAKQYFIRVNNDVIIEPVTVTATTGTIRYNDNNQLVTGGIVKALRFDETTGQVITTTTSPIDANGNYSLSFDIPYYTHYIVAYPNSEPESDFIPTYFPQTINWQTASTINSGVNNSSINIGVFRKSNSSGPNSILGVTNKSNNNILFPLPQTLIYLKSGSTFLDFSESISNGRYNFSSLSTGSYEIIATKLGYSTSTQTIQLNSPLRDSINFILDQVLVGVNSISNIIPKKFSLYQNYPNPFNPVTNIRFDIPKSSFVTIKIYNVLGKESALLLNENKSAGSYEIDFDASTLTTGVYFYRIETQEFTQIKKMILLK